MNQRRRRIDVTLASIAGGLGVVLAGWATACGLGQWYGIGAAGLIGVAIVFVRRANRCPHCLEVIELRSPHTRFCPRCGREVSPRADCGPSEGEAGAARDGTSPGVATADPRDGRMVDCETLDAIRSNAEAVRQSLSSKHGVEMEYGMESLARLDELIGGIGGKVDEAARRALIAMNGAFVGEAIIAMYGGCWIEDSDRGLGVRTCGGLVAFPFSKVAKLVDSGEFDSVASFARAIPFIERQSGNDGPILPTDPGN